MKWLLKAFVFINWCVLVVLCRTISPAPDCIGSVESGCKSNSTQGFATELKLPGDVCSWKNQNAFTNDTCIMTISPESEEKFLRKYKKELNFIRLNLTFDKPTEKLCGLLPNVWTWTHTQENGGFDFLKMDPGFGFYSLRILTQHAAGPIDLTINVSGDCKVRLGEEATTNRIARALRPLESKMAQKGDMAISNNSVWCYHDQTYPDPKGLYVLCKYIICPIELLNYRCCNNTSCNQTIYNNAMWCMFPVAIGYLIFVFFPIVLMSVSAKVNMGIHLASERMLRSRDRVDNSEHSTLLSSNDRYYGSVNENEATTINALPREENTGADCLFKGDESHTTIWYFISRILISPLAPYPDFICRLTRILFIFTSNVIVVLDIVLHRYYIYKLSLAQIKANGHVSFVSMLAGVRESQKNFLSIFGGPYIALGFYLIIGSLIVYLPKDFSAFLQTGIQDFGGDVVSPLFVNCEMLKDFGMSLVDSREGYANINTVLLAQLSMAINPGFWRFAVEIQIRRFRKLYRKIGLAFSVLIGLPYVAISILELAMCLVRYCFPIVGFINIIITAHSKKLKEAFGNKKGVTSIVMLICRLIGCAMVFYSMYMFSLVFTYSFHFLLRVAMYTFIAMFVYPTKTYCSLIFYFYIIIYYFQSVNGFSHTYSKLFSQTINVSESLSEENPQDTTEYLTTHDGVKGISSELFDYVVNSLKPRRLELTWALLKTAMFILVLTVSFQLIDEFGRVNRVPDILNIISVFVIGGVPKLLSHVTSGRDRGAEARLRKDIKKVVLTYWAQRSRIVVE